MQHYTAYLETALHVSGVTTTHHQERKQLYLQHLVFVTPLLLPAAIAADSAPDDGWWYHSKHVEHFSDKINCVTLHLVGYILELSRAYKLAYSLLAVLLYGRSDFEAALVLLVICLA
jgi:hypothetical protein